MPSSADGKWLRVSLCGSAAAIAGAFLCGKLLAQAVERSDWSIESQSHHSGEPARHQ
jgi:hypothetical protein